VRSVIRSIDCRGGKKWGGRKTIFSGGGVAGRWGGLWGRGKPGGGQAGTPGARKRGREGPQLAGPDKKKTRGDRLVSFQWGNTGFSRPIFCRAGCFFRTGGIGGRTGGAAPGLPRGGARIGRGGDHKGGVVMGGLTNPHLRHGGTEGNYVLTTGDPRLFFFRGGLGGGGGGGTRRKRGGGGGRVFVPWLF